MKSELTTVPADTSGSTLSLFLYFTSYCDSQVVLSLLSCFSTDLHAGNNKNNLQFLHKINIYINNTEINKSMYRLPQKILLANFLSFFPPPVSPILLFNCWVGREEIPWEERKFFVKRGNSWSWRRLRGTANLSSSWIL